MYSDWDVAEQLLDTLTAEGSKVVIPLYERGGAMSFTVKGSDGRCFTFTIQETNENGEP